ncbi:unnamed protein product [Clonostachys solani]|uniref:Uncharacterized protein n=1 Tax=Clonostachys solani TaxID=160281 RepID=A0A9N9YX32_9HYPO|nr:unnamed protein product [Clonostachys solani]
MTRSGQESTNANVREITPKHGNFAGKLPLLGCSVTSRRGDATVLRDVFDIVECARRPIKDVIPMAMELNLVNTMLEIVAGGEVGKIALEVMEKIGAGVNTA